MHPLQRLLPRIVLGLLLATICMPTALAADEADEEAGYQRLFNGKDLSGWEGDERFWSVEEDYIQGETTPDNKAPHNTFLIWREGKLKDFHLKLKFRILTGNNSGVQYRSKDLDEFRISGYQAEVENEPVDVGFLYHERGRGRLVQVGEFVEMDAEGNKNVAGHVADIEELKKGEHYHDKDWNEYHIIARGNHVVHYLNNQATMELIDNDPEGRLLEGVLALQIHGGQPMTVQFKDIRVKHLDSTFGEARRLFNGDNLDGWTFSGEDQAAAWAVHDGALANSGQPIGYIRTVDDHTNYVLRLQLRHREAGNSGVLLRVVGEDKVWPRSIEAQGQNGHLGDIWNIDKFPMQVAEDRTSGRRTEKRHPSNERPVGQWNDYEMILDGEELSLVVNNLLQNKATNCLETLGKIGIQSEGTGVEFRNIVLIPIEY